MLVNSTLEVISGIVSFCVGLLYLIIVASAALYIHSLGDGLFLGAMATWSLALVIASGRAGAAGVVFRIVSLAILVMGPLAAAIWLPDLHKFRS